MEQSYSYVVDSSLSEGLIIFSGHNITSLFSDPLKYSFFYKELAYNAFIANPFLPWLVLVLVIDKVRWNKPIIYILISFYLCHGTNKFFSNLAFSLSVTGDSIPTFPYTMSKWYLGYVISPLFCFGGEMLGDWYLLIRTRAILSTERIPKVYYTIFLYNLSKVLCMLGPFFFTPSNIKNFETKYLAGYYTFSIVSSILLQITSIIYDVTIIYYLRKNLFMKFKNNRILMKNGFFEKLKQTSEYRIIISIAFSFMIIPTSILLFLRAMNKLRIYAERDINNPRFVSYTDSYILNEINKYSNSSNHLVTYTPNDNNIPSTSNYMTPSSSNYMTPSSDNFISYPNNDPTTSYTKPNQIVDITDFLNEPLPTKNKNYIMGALKYN